MRRAARHGRLLEINGAFLSEVCETVIKENEQAYPELRQKQNFIKKLISVEEENFAKTIDQGLELLNNEIDKEKSSVLPGEVAFKLNDTFGFPIDLTKEILADRGMTVDENKFNELLFEQKNRARAARTNAKAQAWANENLDFSDVKATSFVGYEKLNAQTTVLKLIKDDEFVDFAVAGDKVEIILEESPFYAQGGGQVGDSGVLTSAETEIEILDTVKNSAGIYLHAAEIQSGVLKVGDAVTASVDATKRNKIMRNHTAAHLLQAALRKTLGEHVEQAGQLVDENRLRFDFTHFSALSADELKKIEKLINDEILLSEPVDVAEMSLSEAKKNGAMALFGEKYGDIVRVVKAGDFSTELCGGTHVSNTAQLGVFKIVSECSVASGVRRIEAVTSMGVLNLLYDELNLFNDCQKVLKVNQQEELVNECRHLMDKLKNSERTITKLNSEMASFKVNDLISTAKDMGKLKVIVSKVENFDNDTLKLMCDDLKSRFENMVVVLANVSSEKSSIIVSAGKAALEYGINAGLLVKEIAKLAGGNGGGRKDMAMAGIKDVSKIDSALGKVYDLVNSFVN